MFSLVAKHTTRACSAAVITAALALSPVMRAAVPDYKLGDVATADVVTPVPLVVPHPEATDALKEKVAQQAPSIVRFNSRSAGEAEAELRASIATARKKFMTALQAALRDRAPGEADIGTPAYTAAFEYTSRDSAKNLPLEQLAALWLRGKSDQPFVETLLKPVRETMAQTIIADGDNDTPLPANQSVLLIPVRSFSEPVAIDSFETNGQVTTPGKLTSLWLAHRLVQTNFPPGQEQLGEFAASFVRANAYYDPALTKIVRTKRTFGFAINDTFDAAQIIVHKGQTIDRKALSALAVLREKSLIGTLQNKLEEEQSVAGQMKSQTTWVEAGLGILVVALLLLLWRLRVRPADTLIPVFANPALASSAQAALPGAAGDGAWQSRALLAEGKVEQAHAAIRSGALGWMRDKIFRTMANQRSELLSAQQHAETEMQELEQRLEQLQAPLQERIAAYEKRIESLEQEVAARQTRVQELEQQLITATQKAREASRVVIGPSKEAVDRVTRNLELTLGEREKAVDETELRLAERARDLDETDALLRAREALLASAWIRLSGSRPPITVTETETLNH